MVNKMFLVPFLFSPGSFAYQAYKNTQYEFPVIKRTWGIFPERIPKGTLEYNDALSNLPGRQIKRNFELFLKEKEIRDDLIISERNNLGICGATGTNYFRKGDAAIFVSPGFENEDRGACHFLVKHEVAHIYNNDLFTIPLVHSICATAAAIFVTCYGLPLITSILITIAVGLVAHSLFSIYREGKADDFAIENSSNEELLGGRRLLLAVKEIFIQRRISCLMKLLISAEGENRADILHPSLSRRIKKIENVLASRGVTINDDAENRKLERLTDFFKGLF